MQIQITVEVKDNDFLEYYNTLDTGIKDDICDGTDMQAPFQSKDIPTIIVREIEGWLNHVEVMEIERVG